MITIYNSKTKSVINIDDSVDWIQVTPMDYLKPAHIKIEMKGFFLGQHAASCKDCNSFIKSFGKESNEWFVVYNLKKYKIATNSIGSKEFGENELKHTISDFVYGTTLTFSVLELNIEELNQQLENAVLEEDYKNACVYRDLIKEANN